MRLDLRISIEVEQWIRGFGAAVEVDQPLWLRARLREEARRLSELYRSDSEE